MDLKTQPDGQTCTVSNGSGIISAGSNQSFAVFCASEVHPVRGTVSGLGDGESLTLQLNGEPYVVTADGAYQFPTGIPFEASYLVIVAVAPGSKICSVAQPSGTMGHADVDGVDVSCSLCGNGTPDPGEACDAGEANGATECPYGQAACETCSADCSAVVTLPRRYCGDGTRDVEEACDQGTERNGATTCAYGQSSCVTCSVDCAVEQNVTGPFCGEQFHAAARPGGPVLRRGPREGERGGGLPRAMIRGCRRAGAGSSSARAAVRPRSFGAARIFGAGRSRCRFDPARARPGRAPGVDSAGSSRTRLPARQRLPEEPPARRRACAFVVH